MQSILELLPNIQEFKKYMYINVSDDNTTF